VLVVMVDGSGGRGRCLVVMVMRRLGGDDDDWW
ncbi:hypothetical protein Tco_1581639, partial [Tanacetum coccineum]